MPDQVDVSQEEVEALTNQFYVTLKAYVARLSKDDEERSPKSFTQVEELLKDEKITWSNAYQIEQLLVDLFDDRNLEVELQSRLLEAESNLGPALAAQYLKLAAGMKTPVERRALLRRLVNDLQWRYTVNEVKRTYAKEITRITGLIFIVTIGLFAAAVLGRAIFGKPSPETADVALLLLAGLAGGWGAGFSMVAGLRSRLDAADLNDLKLLKSKWILWSRPLIGVGAACILYFFLISGLLGGTAFPTLNGPATQPSPRDVALLVVWCFVAGFSERLVPALLSKTEGRAIGQSSLGPDRFKPSPGAGGGADQSGAEAKGQEKTESRSTDTMARSSVSRETEPPKGG